MISKLLFSTFIVKNVFDEKFELSRNTLNFNVFWKLMKTYESISLKDAKLEQLEKLFKRILRVVDIFKILKFIVIIKFSRRKFFKNFRRFKYSFSTKFENEFKNELTNKNDQFLNIVMIDVAIFHRLTRKKNKINFDCFF